MIWCKIRENYNTNYDYRNGVHISCAGNKYRIRNQKMYRNGIVIGYITSDHMLKIKNNKISLGYYYYNTHDHGFDVKTVGKLIEFLDTIF